LRIGEEEESRREEEELRRRVKVGLTAFRWGAFEIQIWVVTFKLT